MGPSVLERKLLRELSLLKGQIATISLVVAGGIACFLCLRGTCDSLEWTLAAYYDRYRFADVFATAEIVPESVASRIEALPGVGTIQTRIAKDVAVPLEGMDRPAFGRLLSLPPSGEPATNTLRVVAGRLPRHGPDDEVAVLESFAAAHGLQPGHRLPAVINGKLRSLRVVGVVLSPEFLFAMRPGSLIADPQRYALLWMERSVLASAFRLDGAFNDVSLRLQPGASEGEVRARLDRILQPYGGNGAVGRANQASSRMATTEISMLESIADTMPVVFLGVSAFLIYMVLGRLITLQRPELATLKAVGYTNREVAAHYLGLVVVVMVPAGALGTAGGWYLGRLIVPLYGTFFHVPDFSFRMTAGLVSSGLLVSAVAAAAGALLAVRRAVTLPPAEAMRPPAPPHYGRSLMERLGLSALAGNGGLMVVREIERRPLRTLLSALGMAGAIALVVFGHFGTDSFDAYVDGTLRREQRQDLSVTFAHPLAERAVGYLARRPGVSTAEGLRVVPVHVRYGARTRDSALVGLPDPATLRQLVTRAGGTAVGIPDDGVLMTKTLGDVLGLGVGDRVYLELREGDRATVRPVVAGFVDETTGLQVYAHASLVASLEKDLGAVSSVLLKVDPSWIPALEAHLRRLPAVVDVSDIMADVHRMQDMNAQILDIRTAIMVTFAVFVVFGVVYNNARIALHARARDLATLRVLGMSRGEISSILIGSLSVEVALSIPIGLWLGRAWAVIFMGMADQETFRWAVVVPPRTYLLSAAVALLAAVASALWVRRSLDKLDLVAVLKARE